MGSPSTLQTVDDRGYVFVTEAAECQIVSSDIDVVTGAIFALPPTPLAARRRMYIKNLSSDAIYVGGADVTTSNGYEVPMDNELILDVTDDIIVFATSASATSSDVRVLELS